MGGIKIGAQLYTVRAFTQTEEAFAETIKKVADIGYPCVQISGAGPIPAARMADICQRNNIEAVITHTGADRIINETEAAIADHKRLGARYIGLGSIPDKYKDGAAGIRRFITDFLPAVEKIRAAGMTFMYHNHAFEFEKFEGKRMIEYFAEGFPADGAGFTLDTYWVQAAGGDPAAWLIKLSGRVNVIHVKDMKIQRNECRMAEVGEGNLNWAAIRAACETAGVRYAMVEQDDCYGADPFECLRTSFHYLKGWE